jgi:hypothetical protein
VEWNVSEHADSETIDFLTRERTAIIDAALGHVTSHHYESAGEIEVRRRLEALFDRAVESLTAQDMGPMVTYARQIAQERFSAGYDLSEVQTGFNALEAATWTRVLATLPPDRFARTLGLVSTILGAGKDALARTYVSLATDAHAPSLDLRTLFAGTDGST